MSSTNGTAHAPAGYGPATNRMITIAAGTKASPTQVWIQTNLDGLTESAETFALTFTTSSVGNGPQTATGTIQANNT